MLHVRVHDISVGKKTNKYGLFGKLVRRKPLLSKKNMVVWLRFDKSHLKAQTLWNSVLNTDKTKVKMFGHDAQRDI